MEYEIIHDDCLSFLESDCRTYDTVFCDPPDNVGLKYDGFSDSMTGGEYRNFTRRSIQRLLCVAPIVWWSFNAKHLAMMGWLAYEFNWNFKSCVQIFTFGQNNVHDLSNCHRPLWRISRDPNPTLYPDAVKVPSWRQENGDKRAKPGGKVPGDVFDFPRVTGNSKQRRAWHKTQLNEGLVERCLKLTTPPGGRVLDPFAGTGSTLRVCKRLDFDCTLVEISEPYFKELIKEHPDGHNQHRPA